MVGKEEALAAIEACTSVRQLNKLWKELEFRGYTGPNEQNPQGGLMYRAVQQRKASIKGEKAPTFVDPPGSALPEAKVRIG